jgi:hypothetical protein
MNSREQLAKEFMQTAALILQNTTTGFAARILEVDEATYKPSRDIQKVVVKLAFKLADEFIPWTKM